MRDRIGSYRIERELGSTGACLEYEAVHVVLPRRAVVKVADEAVAWVRPVQVQVLREACILEALHHVGVVGVYEAGVLDNKCPWFAHEHVPGVRLDEALAKGTLPPDVALRVVRDLASVLAHAHRRGVVHGGLRPDRIVLPPRSRGVAACVVDWSEARTHDATIHVPPPPDAPEYISPEAARGDAIDDRADVYALGMIAQRALAGAVPEIHGIVEQMLAADRWDRPSSSEVCSDLELVAAAAPVPYLRKPKWTPMDSVVTPTEVGSAVPGHSTDEV